MRDASGRCCSGLGSVHCFCGSTNRVRAGRGVTSLLCELKFFISPECARRRRGTSLSSSRSPWTAASVPLHPIRTIGACCPHSGGLASSGRASANLKSEVNREVHLVCCPEAFTAKGVYCFTFFDATSVVLPHLCVPLKGENWSGREQHHPSWYYRLVNGKDCGQLAGAATRQGYPVGQDCKTSLSESADRPDSDSIVAGRALSGVL
jgi:hypothetical protein